MQRLCIGYAGHTYGVRYSGVIEKLWCDRYCYGYATRIHGLYFNDLAHVFYTAASRMHMPCICILSVILYLLFIKYFKFYNNFFCIYAAYTQT